MKTTVVAFGLVLASVVGAAAQDVIIVPEQETVIREYVRSRPVASIQVPGVTFGVGTAVPDDVELYAVEGGDVDYRYVVVDDRTLLVEPGTRRVVRVLD